MTTTISKDTRVTIGLMLLVVAPLMSVVVLLVRVQAKLDQLVSDTYTLTQAESDALREALANPGHAVPDPRNPGQLIVVDGSRRVMANEPSTGPG